MVENFNLGIIGYNDGNGHPYSFSAIINGYHEEEMSTCEYPVIYNYLSKRASTEIGISGLKVTHIWTPEIERSRKIAACAYIDHVVNDLSEMVNYVDAVIIARDDAESHVEIAKIFIENDIKVFIDKPLCKTLEDLNYFQPYIAKGLVFSTSGFRYHPAVERLRSTKNTTFIYQTFNDWFKYGVHVLEGAYSIVNSPIVSVENIGDENTDFVIFECKNNAKIIIIRNESFRLFKGYLVDCGEQIVYNDNFLYFKNMLLDFKEFLNSTSYSFSSEQTCNIIKALILAQESKSINKKIYIDEIKG